MNPSLQYGPVNETKNPELKNRISQTHVCLHDEESSTMEESSNDFRGPSVQFETADD
eukprot:CAMPEP_0185760640 /NCGR_PEP_ID=MMETSP1174-20130828/19555_1 /TAXON_ID=35687 /ORGANISM="Dictyocha speculum, Strain CCMP1381" /LENGTH=56 /DNA_ID=CAMNT_0028441545 /DNA_START=118 /DNA_END=285 /DNA_ORIENTATION=+